MDGLHYNDDVGTSSLRLVEISVEPDESRLIPSLTVSTHLLVDLPVYFALSYTWGPPSVGDVEYDDVDKVPILLNGKRLRVSESTRCSAATLSLVSWRAILDRCHLHRPRPPR